MSKRKQLVLLKSDNISASDMAKIFIPDSERSSAEAVAEAGDDITVCAVSLFEQMTLTAEALPVLQKLVMDKTAVVIDITADAVARTAEIFKPAINPITKKPVGSATSQYRFKPYCVPRQQTEDSRNVVVAPGLVAFAEKVPALHSHSDINIVEIERNLKKVLLAKVRTQVIKPGRAAVFVDDRGRLDLPAQTFKNNEDEANNAAATNAAIPQNKTALISVAPKESERVMKFIKPSGVTGQYIETRFSHNMVREFVHWRQTFDFRNSHQDVTTAYKIILAKFKQPTSPHNIHVLNDKWTYLTNYFKEEQKMQRNSWHMFHIMEQALDL